MNGFPAHIRFKYPWRNYQQAVLDQLDVFLHNRHLHVVAPPGSGKTVLGIEAAVRLNKPTLVLAPTLTIRNQWISRLCELFLDTDQVPQWVSTDVWKPGFFTAITYQGLHAACAQATGAAQVVRTLKAAGVHTLVLDEAHHLHSQWWASLTDIKKALQPTIIGLTATPPYDVAYPEWERYIAMNGEIDMEISVPQLIQELDLCPHQDYVYLCQPTRQEGERIQGYRQHMQQVYEEYAHSTLLVEAWVATEVWQQPMQHLEWIYEHLEVYTSFVILLRHNGYALPKMHAEVLGLDAKEQKAPAPPLSYERLECVLNYFLFQDKVWFAHLAEVRGAAIASLRHRGLVEHSTVNLVYHARLSRMLLASTAKLQGIVQIVRHEHAQLGAQLRMVILADYIRPEYLLGLDQARVAERELKMGVVPIFEELLQQGIPTTHIGVLTGSLVILPQAALVRFEQLCVQRGVPAQAQSHEPYHGQYALLGGHVVLRQEVVHIVTQLFTEGYVQVLVGTKALLGEGWDAPAINSLVLASFVGSFVLSNQMRGRAIRTERNNPGKTSNIWHLVCIDPTDPHGGSDLEQLSRRFKSFVGLSADARPYIGNGLGRLGLDKVCYSAQETEQVNAATMQWAEERAQLAARWQQAIRQGTRLVDEIRLPFEGAKQRYRQLKQMHLRHTIVYFLIEVVMLWGVYFSEVLKHLFKNLRSIRSVNGLWWYLGLAALAGMVLYGRKTYKALRLYLGYRDIAKDIKHVATALLLALYEHKVIRTSKASLCIHAEQYPDGTVSCYLEGGTRAEQSLFANTLAEVVAPVGNPRYLVERRGKGVFLGRRTDYHAVPTVLGTHKQHASSFHAQWVRCVGPSELVYTRTPQGRKFLLRARVKSLAAQLHDTPPEQYRKWA